jgi:hypothetical protein
VLLNGVLIIENFDILRTTNGVMNVPYVTTNNTHVPSNSNFITIEFIKLIDYPSINGIEVIHIGSGVPIKAPIKAPPVSSPIKVPVHAVVPLPASVPQTPTQIVPVGDALYRINCGSSAPVTVASPNSVVWNPDQYVTTGLSFNTCNNITSTSNIYCTSRYFRTANGAPFRYTIPVPLANHTYEVRLHFAEQVRFFRK